MGGMQIGQQVRGLQDQGNINRLAGQAANSTGMERTSALNQMWGVNPQMAAQQETALGTSEDRRNKGMVQAARMLSGAPEAMRPGLYQQMKPMLSQYGLQLPEQYDNTVAEAANALVQAYGGIADSAPSGLRQFQGIAEAAGLKPGSAEYQRAARVNLGLDGRASGAGYSLVKFTGPDGRERIGTMSGATGVVSLPDGTTFDPRASGVQVQDMGQSSAQPQQAPSRNDMEADIELANSMIAAGIPEGQVDAFLQSRGSRVPASQPPVQNASAGMFVGPTKAEEAGAVEQAKTNVQLSALPIELGMRTQAAQDQALGIERGRSQIERENEAATRVRNASDTLNLLDNAERLLGDATGSGIGALVDRGAALFGQSTSGAQANAALKTLAGQLTSKVPRMEGPQSDRDVQMYKEMAGDLANDSLPSETRMSALREIRRLNAKYASQQGAPRQTQQANQQAPRARNPQTGEVVEYRNGQWVKVQ